VSRPERPDHDLSVSVVVAAHTMDRWADMVAGLDALGRQSVPPLETILVVDHNDALLERARGAFPDVRVMGNPRTGGASGARNTGVAAARGTVIAFLDDDARPEPDWVERLLSGYDDPEVQAVGGVARPVWPVRRPAHLPPELDWLVGCTYLGQPTVRTDVRNLWGCNMSVRAEVFERIGGFDEEVGRVGLVPLGNEETELCIRLAQRVPGARVVFEPSAVVHHRVTEARCRWSYLVTRSHAEGISKAAMSRVVGTGDATSEERRYATRVLPKGVLRELARLNLRGAVGIVTCLAVTSWWYVRGRLGHASTIGAEGSSARARAGGDH
jgi:GT2 family glycosyltransferase